MLINPKNFVYLMATDKKRNRAKKPILHYTFFPLYDGWQMAMNDCELLLVVSLRSMTIHDRGWWRGNLLSSDGFWVRR